MRSCTQSQGTRSLTAFSEAQGIRGSASVARRVALDPAALEAAGSRFDPDTSRNMTKRSSKLALAEELAYLGDIDTIYPLTENTLLTVPGAATGRRTLISASCVSGTSNSILLSHRLSIARSRRS